MSRSPHHLEKLASNLDKKSNGVRSVLSEARGGWYASIRRETARRKRRFCRLDISALVCNNDAMTNKKRTLYQRLFDSKVAIPVKKVEASRAIFESQDVQRIDLRITDEAGNTLTLELKDRHAYDMIQQLTVAYQAIPPSLPSSGYGQHWGMQ